MNGPKEPFGYKYNEKTMEKEPVAEEIRALAKAAEYIEQGCSMRSVRDWVEKKTGRYISVPGLLKAIGYVSKNR
jgi:hypothetical protein